jgi:predicted GH43/DUF377 family glycosyl hydrolase
MDTAAGMKHWGQPLIFDPSEGETIVLPAAEGDGHWAGAPSVVYDALASQFYLYYRVRQPRPVRGGHCYIAASTDGRHFENIWSATKEQFDSASVERFALTKGLDGRWLLYPSYVDPADGRWRIDVIEAHAPDAFDVSQRHKVFSAGDVGVEGVKDPWVMTVNGLYVMLISYAVALPLDPAQQSRAHASADIYNTGLTLSSSALAISGDGRAWEWLGDVLAPRRGQWDAYAARLGCLVPTAHGWFGFYDGGASVNENYEERTGLVQSWDLRHFHRLSQSGPALVSPEGSGSLRYIDAVVMGDEVWCYYEYARADGSHELRMNRAKR